MPPRTPVGRAARKAQLIARRTRRRALRPWRQVRYRKQGVECPVCGSRYARFDQTIQPPNRICYGCGLMERHRLLVLWLRERADLLPDGCRVLHFAPERAVAEELRSLAALRYVSVDLMSPAADLRADIMRLPFSDDVFDLIICSHVLEHVDDDAAALRALNRVLSPEGHMIVLLPVDESRAETYEDATIVSPEDREAAFWQSDHVRLYGRDVVDRLAAGGFEVSNFRADELFGPQAVARYQLWPFERLMLLKPSR